MKKNALTYCILLILGLISFLAQAQELTTLTGIIKEKKGEVLPGVMVTIKNETGAPVSFTTTDRNGRFSISFSKDLKKCTLNVSYLGFKPQTFPVEKFKSGGILTMDEESYQLKEVTVKLPEIKSSGDTITYNVASFKTASDRTIEDIIKKLPGISVSDQGIISYNGEAINKFYIEGLDMLSGRYALATRNISPDDVQSVNVYENHQPKRVLNGIKYSDKAALNLKLKKKSMLKPIGYVKGGAGIDDDSDIKWIGEAFGMFIAPKNQNLVTLKGNNVAFSYINETRTMTDGDNISNTKASGIYPANPFGSANIPTTRYFDNRSLSSSINSVFKLSETINLSFTADYSDEINSYNNLSDISYTIGNDGTTTINETVSNQPHQRQAKATITIENNAASKYFSDRLSFAGRFDANRYKINDGNLINQNISTTDLNFKNKFDGILRISKHIINFSSIIQASTTPRNRLTATNDNLEFISQNIKGFNFSNTEEMGYTWQLTQLSSLGVNGVFNIEYTTFKSFTYNPASNADNDIHGYDITTSIEPEYKLQIPSVCTLTLSAPLRLRDFSFDNISNSKDYTLNRFDADLKVRIMRTFPFNLKTSISGGRQVRLGGMTDFIENPIYMTFRRQSTLGNGETTNRSTWFASSDLSYRNTIEGIFSSATLIYRHTKSNRLSGLSISGDDNISTSFRNLNNNMNSFNVAASFSKKVYKWHTTFAVDGSFELLNRDILRQNNLLKLDATSYLGRISINSNPLKDYIIIGIEARYSGSRSSIGKNMSVSTTHDITSKISFSSQPQKNIEFGIHGNFSQSKMSSQITKNSFYLDCNFNFHKNHYEIELTARNLTNQRVYSYGYITNSDRYFYSFDLRPIEAFVTFKYNF